MLIKNILDHATFRPEKMAKVDLLRAAHLFAGLNCLEPGQEHAAHIHADQDKLYYVVEGTGTATVADATYPISPGDLILAPAAIEHSLAASTRLTVMVIFSPPPQP